MNNDLSCLRSRFYLNLPSRSVTDTFSNKWSGRLRCSEMGRFGIEFVRALWLLNSSLNAVWVCPIYCILTRLTLKEMVQVWRVACRLLLHFDVALRTLASGRARFLQVPGYYATCLDAVAASAVWRCRVQSGVYERVPEVAWSSVGHPRGWWKNACQAFAWLNNVIMSFQNRFYSGISPAIVKA